MSEERLQYWTVVADTAASISVLEAALLKADSEEDIDSKVEALMTTVVDFQDLCGDRFPIADAPGYHDSDALDLQEMAAKCVQLVDDVVKLVKHASEDPSVFPVLSVSRKLLVKALQSVSSLAARHRAELKAASSAPPRSKALPRPPDSSSSASGSPDLSLASDSPSSRRLTQHQEVRKSLQSVPSKPAPVPTIGRSHKGSSRSVHNNETGATSPFDLLRRSPDSSPRAAAGTMMEQSVVEMEQVAARFYHVSCYDRPRQRFLVHGGLRRDKPSRMCASSVFQLDLHDLTVAEEAAWYELETNGIPIPALCWHSGTLLDLNHWMVFGGKASNNQMTNSAYLLDLETNIWTALSPSGTVPEPRAGHSLVRLPNQDESLLFGGIDGTGTRCFNDVYLFNHSQQSWRPQSTSQAPVGRFAHSMVLLQEALFLFGGLRGSLAKSVPGSDLWCLSLSTWEWYQPQQTGERPEAGTYTMAALEGEWGTDVAVIGAKPFEDNRDSYYVFEITGFEQGRYSVHWRRGIYSKQRRPLTSEGHSVVVVGSKLLVVGGRPGDQKSSFIDLAIIPKTDFHDPNGGVKKFVPSPFGSTSSPSIGQLSRSHTTSEVHPRASVSAAGSRVEKPVPVSNTLSKKALSLYLSGKGGVEQGSPRTASMSTSSKKLFTSSGSVPALQEGDQLHSPTAESQIAALRAENASLREKLANLQLNFELELSKRLDSESRAQSLHQAYRTLRETSDTLQVETSRLYQLAMSEVAANPSAQEKLQRRYEELRSATQFSEPSRLPEGGVVQARANVANSDKRAAPRRKEEQTQAHKQSVEVVNGELNQLLQSAMPSKATRLSMGADTKQDAQTMRKLWLRPESAENFALFAESAGRLNEVMLCRAVVQLLNAPRDTLAAMAENIVVEYLDANANFAVITLPERERKAIADEVKQGGAAVQEGAYVLYWEAILDKVEAMLQRLFESFCVEMVSLSKHQGSARMRATSNGMQSAQHAILLSAETQLREKLAELESSEGVGDEHEQDTFLFKKVTSEMVATEINYVTDLKVITTIFRRPLTDEKSFVLPLDVVNIFANIEDVYAINRKFLTALQKEHGKPLASKNYGKVFLEFASQLQKVYLVYASRKTVSRNTLDQLANSNKQFVKFLEECLQKPPCRRLELKSFLIKPVQRICKYPLLLRTMVESCPRDYTDKAGLVEAKKKMEEVVGALEDQLFVEDDKLRLLELEGALNWHREPKLVLAVPERMLLHDGVLIGTEVQVGKGGGDDTIVLKNLRNFHLYLCTDLLLVVEEREKKGQRRDFLQHVVGLAYSVIIPVAGKPAFQVLQPRIDFKFLFRAANADAKQLWMSKINDAILGIRTKLKIGAGASGGPGAVVVTGSGGGGSAPASLGSNIVKQLSAGGPNE